MRFPSVLALSLVAMACAPKAEAPAAPAAAEPLSAAALDSAKAVDAAFAAAMNAKDTTALFSDVYAADALLLPPDAPVLTGADLRAALVGLVAGGAGNFVMTTRTAYGIGDLAYIVGEASFTMGGNTETVKYTEVVRRGADGKWRYVVDMFSGLGGAAKPAAH